MKVILSNQVASLTGSLGRGFGYSIQRQGNGFFSKRDSRGFVPHDGHWRFIATCAELAQNRLHITDILLDWQELLSALCEARHWQASEKVRRNYTDGAKTTYNAADIINLKITFGI